MASSKEYLNFVLEQLSELDNISHRAMMGEYILYYKGKIIGGIYDDRFLEDKLLVMKFLEILLCMYFQHKGEKVIMKTKIDRLEKEIDELKKKKRK